MKAATLESKFPILSVEHDCIISKDADIYHGLTKKLTFDRMIPPYGSTLLAKDGFIYCGAITLELESDITDRIVLLAGVRERVLWGGSLGKFSTQFGLGVKFIIN